MSEKMICKNCKYHYIEEISFDYPQSCCRKASGTTEQWCKCNNFEYGDRYIEQLQQENKELHNKIDKAIEYIETNGYGYDCCGDMCYFLDENNQKDLLEILKESEVDECE